MTKGLEHLVPLDARTFQKPLGELAETLAQKVLRESLTILGGPKFLPVDLHVLVRKAMRTYDLLFYLNADERREGDCYWKPVYTIVTLPLVRNMIDCLYNITTILQDPPHYGSWFRKSGYKQQLKALDEDEAKFGGIPEWDEWIKRNRDTTNFGIRNDNLTMSDVLAQPMWPTLGKYLGDKGPGGSYSPHQTFLKTFTFGHWREYSAMAHGAFEGLLPVAFYYAPDSMPFDDRPKLDEIHHQILALHIARTATVLLCIVTELQAHFHFDGARIDERIHKVWNALTPVFEAKELFTNRYAKLMSDKGIYP